MNLWLLLPQTAQFDTSINLFRSDFSGTAVFARSIFAITSKIRQRCI